MSLTDDLSRSLETNLAAVAPPPGDPDGAMRRGRGIRRRRTTLRTGGVVAAVAAVVLGGTLLVRPVAEQAPEPIAPPVRLLDPLDLEGGLRAVASPGEALWLGGEVLSADGLGEIDVAGAATPFGLVFFSGGRALLLDADGVAEALSEPVAEVPDGFRPTARADAALPLVAFTLPDPDGVRVVLRDLRTDRVVGERVVDCTGGACSDVGVEAVDRGLVFVRTPDGPFVWDPTGTGGGAAWTALGPVEVRVADVRGGTILWSDAPPEPAAGSPVADWPATEGEVDSQLTFDGGHVLAWDGTLRPTTPDGRSIRLDAPRAIFFAVDTDGSVLAATYDGKVWDCVLPSGRCTWLGRLPRGGGDPAFIGTDM